jgi:hypothetical protein
MQRDAWTALLDFVAIVGGPPPAPTVTTQRTTNSSRRQQIHFAADNATLDMLYNGVKPCFGRLALSELDGRIDSNQLGIRLTATTSSLLMEDADTGRTGRLYPQRLWAVCAKNDERARLEFYRYSMADADLRRDTDMTLSLTVPTLQASYVHTHAYLIELINYWLHFVTLTDTIAAQRAIQRGEQV